MRINHNIPALNAHRLLNANSSASAKSLERLSSGKRINRAADDAAGMAISEKMKAQVRGLKKAAQNTLDGISLIQTAEGAMNEVHSMLQRMRELAVQAANGTMADADRSAVQDEINQLTSEVNRIANGAEFNKRNILRGNTGPDSNTIVHRMSTGQPASFTASKAFASDADVAALGNLTSQQFSIWIDGQERVVNLNKMDGSAANSTRDSLLEALNNAMGDLGQAIWTDGNVLEITSASIGGNSEVKLTGTPALLTGLFGDGTPTFTSSTVLAADADVAALGDLSSSNVSVWVDGVEYTVDLSNIDGSGTATKANLLAAFNTALGANGTAAWDAGNHLVITGVGSEVRITGDNAALDKLFGTSVKQDLIVMRNDLKLAGVAEKDTGNAVGTFYFDKLPEVGSTLTIGEEKIEFYDSSKSPYTGSNRPIDLVKPDGTPKTNAELVTELASLSIQGVTLSVDPNVNGRLVVEAVKSGFAGQSIYLEGTPKEFVANLQIGPNQGQGFRLAVGDIRAIKLGISSDTPEGNPGVEGAAFRSVIEVTNGLSEGKIEYSIDVSTEDRATAAITVFDNAIVNVAKMRGSLGAIQNRLEYTAANLENTTENLTAALSRIEDADMALEMSDYTRLNILVQSSTAMLAQANQRPQSVLQLLGQ